MSDTAGTASNENKEDVTSGEGQAAEPRAMHEKGETQHYGETELESKKEKRERDDTVTQIDLEEAIKFIQRQLDYKANQASIEHLPHWQGEITSDLGKLRTDIESISGNIKRVSEELHQFMERYSKREVEVEEVLKEKTDKSKSKLLSKDVTKLDSRLVDIMEEIGFGESLDVSKIPPNILEIVYQTTLDDVIDEIWKNLGPHDTEKVITETLEDVRLRTSGSELFRFDGRRIRTRDLARTIEQRLISAKQIQTTYDELLNKLLEYVPSHKAKNFRAMIKIKSQEYAVDKTTKLLIQVERLEENLSNANRMSAALSAHLNSKTKQIEDKLREEIAGLSTDVNVRFGTLEDRVEEACRVTPEDIDAINANIATLTSRADSHGKAIERLKVAADLGDIEVEPIAEAPEEETLPVEEGEPVEIPEGLTEPKAETVAEEAPAEQKAVEEEAPPKPAGPMKKKEFVEAITDAISITPSKAKLLYDAGYKSVDSLSTATVADLIMIKGIGKTIALRVVEWVESGGPEKFAAPKEEKERKPTFGTITIKSSVEELTAKEMKVYEAIETGNDRTRDIVDATGLDRKFVEKTLKMLVDSVLIELSGKGKNIRYRVKQEEAEE